MLTPTAILETVCAYYDVKTRDLRGPGRCQWLSLPRAVGMSLTRDLTSMSYPRIGAFYGGRDHTTVIAAVRKVQRMIAEGAAGSGRVSLLVEMTEIREALAAGEPVFERRRLEDLREGLVRQIAGLERALRGLPSPEATRAA